MNLESWAHSPPFQGGVAARLQEMAPFLDWRSRGGSYPTHNHPGRSLGSRPPLLGKEGNALDSNSVTPRASALQIRNSSACFSGVRLSSLKYEGKKFHEGNTFTPRSGPEPVARQH